MHLASLSILLVQVAAFAFALPATSLSISISPRVEAPDSTQLKPEKVNLDGNEYTATPLSYGDQGKFSHAFRIEGGFRVGGKLIPAIMKRVFEKEGSDNLNSKTLKEISFLKKSSVDLHLFSKWGKTKMADLPYQIDIVVKDLRGMDPPLKPFYEWYIEDQNIQALGGLSNVRINIKERLLWYAQHEDLLYRDFNMRNMFVQKQAIYMRSTAGDAGRYMEDNFQIMPADWGPTDNDADILGVEFIADTDDKEKVIEEYEEEIDDELEEFFSVLVVSNLLQGHGRQLRSADLATAQFKGKSYQLIHIKEVGNVILYSILGGYDRGTGGAQDVIPAIMSIRDMEDDDGEAEENVQQLKDGGVFIGSEESDGELRIILEYREQQESDEESESDG